MGLAVKLHLFGARGAAALALAAVLGCGGDSSTVPEQFRGAQATATIDGVPWKANFQVELGVADDYPQDQRMEINVLEVNSDQSGRQISLVLKPFTGAGTYVLGPYTALTASAGYYIAAPNVTAKVDSNWVFISNRANAGTVTVTNYNAAGQWISGTFSLDVAQTNNPSKVVHITNGSFDGRVAPGT
jgi:hypothetical protein